MSWCFRYRVKMSTSPEVEEKVGSVIELPGLPPTSVTVSDAYPLGKWVIFKSCGFETEALARSSGERFGDTLLISGALTKMGVDIGFSRSTLQFSDDIHRVMREKTGQDIQAETHGLITFLENSIQIIGFQARAHVSIGIDEFSKPLRQWLPKMAPMTERQRNCALLINDSFFSSNGEGSFILRVSAVEALCDQRDVGDSYTEIIEQVIAFVAKLPADDASSGVRKTLENAKRESLRQSYLRKFRSHKMEDQAKKFDQLYQLRSKFVHDGLGRGDLGQASDDALELAVALLEAELKIPSDK